MPGLYSTGDLVVAPMNPWWAVNRPDLLSAYYTLSRFIIPSPPSFSTFLPCITPLPLLSLSSSIPLPVFIKYLLVTCPLSMSIPQFYFQLDKTPGGNYDKQAPFHWIPGVTVPPSFLQLGTAAFFTALQDGQLQEALLGIYDGSSYREQRHERLISGAPPVNWRELWVNIPRRATSLFRLASHVTFDHLLPDLKAPSVCISVACTDDSIIVSSREIPLMYQLIHHQCLDRTAACFNI